MSWHCGLCRIKVKNWEEHIKSEGHQKKLKDPAFMADAFIESQAEIIKGVKNREDKDGKINKKS